MTSKKVLVAGLPRTGKTTFLAALWYFVQPSGESNGNLTLESLAKGEHEYLNEIAQKWLRCQHLTRTTPVNSTNTGKEAIIMNLKNSTTKNKIVLEIPDFQGETFKQQFENREWDIEYQELLGNINGILLFVNPEATNNMPLLINDANDIANQIGAEPPQSNDGVNIVPWKLELSPNQVKLIDILQFISFYKPNIFPLKLTVLISAWDIVQKTSKKGETPTTWLENKLPLLYQYLFCNSELFEIMVIGISAQGCNYEDHEQVTEMLSKKPQERILINDGSKEYHDITTIIAWLANENNN
jgi:hypothetical protein